MIVPNSEKRPFDGFGNTLAAGGGLEMYTVAHIAIKTRFYRVLHDICFDKYGFDADYYRPGARMTLLHIVAKYTSRSMWHQEEREALQKVVKRCSNLTLKSNLGYTIFG